MQVGHSGNPKLHITDDIFFLLFLLFCHLLDSVPAQLLGVFMSSKLHRDCGFVRIVVSSERDVTVLCNDRMVFYLSRIILMVCWVWMSLDGVR